MLWQYFWIAESSIFYDTNWYPTPVFTYLYILFLSVSRVLHLFLYSFNPSTLHSTLNNNNNSDLSPPKKTLSCRQSESSSHLLWKIYAYFFAGRGSLFPMLFFTSEIFRYQGAGTCHRFSLADPHHPGGPSCGTPNPGNNYKAEPFWLACFFLEFFRWGI